MAVDAKSIVDHQLTLIEALSQKGLLTYDETASLERLIKLTILMRLKGNSPKEVADPYSEITSEELQRLLPLLD